MCRTGRYECGHRDKVEAINLWLSADDIGPTARNYLPCHISVVHCLRPSSQKQLTFCQLRQRAASLLLVKDSLELVLWIHFIQIRLYLFEHKHCLSVLPFKILRTIIKIQHRDASMIHKTSGCSRYFGSLTCLYGAFFEISHLPCPRLISHLKCSNIFRFSSNKSCHYKPNTLFIMPDVWAIF